jgi:hypothetical protein
MSRFCGFIAITAIVIGTGIIGCSKSSDPETLTNRVYLPEKTQATPGEYFAVPVSFDNEVSLSAINVPLLFPSSLLRLDSVSFRGSRADQFMFKNVLAKADTLVIGVIDDTAAVATGRGLLATVYFTANPSARDTTFLLNTFDYSQLPLSYYDLNLDLVANPPTFRPCRLSIMKPIPKPGAGDTAKPK